MNRPPVLRRTGRAWENFVMEPVVRIRNLTYGYHAHEPVLRGLDLEVQPGECLAVVGPNGAGKTTLIMTLAGFCLPFTGEAAAHGLAVAAPNLAAIRARTGFVLQNLDDQLFMPSILEDVMIGPLKAGVAPAAARERALALLGQVGLAALADEFPGHLSAGQKRLATLAAVLVAAPDLLVLDEPTLYLDPWARRALIRQVAALPQSRLIVTHDLEMVLDLCSRVVLLDGGRIVAAGQPHELLADAALLAAHRLEVPGSLQPRPAAR